MHTVKYNTSELPLEWNSILRDNLYMTIPFLKHLEVTQKRQTEYHLFYDNDGKLDSIFVLFIYKHFPFFMFTILPFTKKISMIYYPIPFSRSSIIVGSKTKEEVTSVIKKIKGVTLICNIPKKELLELPYDLSYARCTLKIKWNSFDAYLDALRSHYRYKYRKVLKKCGELYIKEIDSMNFNEKLYRLYENVFEKSDLKINKAELAFFQSNLSKIITINTSSECIGFVQLIANGKELVFSLIGLDYSYTKRYNLYVRLMLEIIKYGIDNGYEKIDLGQTTYDAKGKLGSDIEKLYIQANHHNKLSLKLLLLFRKVLLEKLEYSNTYNVFKNEVKK